MKSNFVTAIHDFHGSLFSFSMSHVSTRTPQHFRPEKSDIFNLSRSVQVTGSSTWIGIFSFLTAACTEWSWKNYEKPLSKPLPLDCKSFICTPLAFLFQILPPQVAVSGLLHFQDSALFIFYLKQQFGKWCLCLGSNLQNHPWALITAEGSITWFATRLNKCYKCCCFFEEMVTSNVFFPAFSPFLLAHFLN